MAELPKIGWGWGKHSNHGWRSLGSAQKEARRISRGTFHVAIRKVEGKFYVYTSELKTGTSQGNYYGYLK